MYAQLSSGATHLMFCEPLLSILCIISISYDITSGSEITPCNKNDKSQVVYRFLGNVLTSIAKLITGFMAKLFILLNEITKMK